MERVNETAGQTFIDGNLRWYRSGTGKDGIPFKEDGTGLPPENIRRQLTEKEGEWNVMVGDRDLAQKGGYFKVESHSLVVVFAACEFPLLTWQFWVGWIC